MLYHISTHDLNRYNLSLMRQQELAVIEEHLLWCRDCLDRSEDNLLNLREKVRTHVDHISIDDLERYNLGHFQDVPTLAELEQHLSECRDCADRKLALDWFIHLVKTGVIKRPFE